ncbi:putative glucan 4-alpha-glucosidase-like protein [Rosellinia necatrix]|uniref:Putative glucan 4-alpha-glucosidase-like protein n=1 Tax=Rosellinia necatrix TaxID=77044 RepID=A0A1W2TQ57_ROSNE|nr:putative glucan 4-alpha-glucosidase-like protein [Rosellinia necatrix]
MTAPNSADGETDPSGPQSSQPETADQNDGLNTDASDDVNTESRETGEDGSAGRTSAPTRRRATTMKPPPTLLTDFLLGRPSPARIAADKKAAREMIRQRRMSLEAVKQEMREAAVQRIQAPGGVRDRVTKWQKANATAMARADPLAAPTEPSEVNIQVDEESVTEEDRVKIKMRQKKRPPLHVLPAPKSTAGDDTNGEEQKKKVHSSPPKKRVVSDTNWVKDHKSKSTSKSTEPDTKEHESGGSPLPKDFLSRPTPNPPVSQKIQEWASRVEIPDEPRKRSHNHKSVGSRSVGSGDGIRAKPMASEILSESEAVDSRSGTTLNTRTSEPQKSRIAVDDGIRIKPLPAKETSESYKRPKPQLKSPPNDGIRVRPVRPDSRDSSTVRAPSPPAVRAASSGAANTPRRRPSPGRKEGIGNPASAESKRPAKAKTPVKSGSKKPSNTRPRRAKSMVETETTLTEDVHDRDSWTSGSESESDIPSSIPQKPLADIPFGYSAFSELELPRGRGGRPMTKQKTNRQSSFKDATNVLKKALNEGKKILTEKVDPPKPVANQPPSIENWLKDTVDPFVDRHDEIIEEPQKKSVEKEWAHESKTRHPGSSSRRSADLNEDDESYHKSHEHKSTSKSPYDDSLDESTTTPSSGRLRRSQATRSVSSPGRGGTRKGFKEKIRDAFRGESTVHIPGRTDYSSYDESVDDDSDRTIECQERPRPSDTRRSPTPSDEDDSFVSMESTSLKPRPLNPKRRPPTTGAHELSTIVSGPEMQIPLGSELSSTLTDTTMTQTTITRNTGLSRSTAVSHKRSQRSGLKRRLTKHSDLISVLSLPDDSTVTSRSRSLRSARSVRRVSNHLHDATVENLLREFARDENLYSRELKTLVDGVIPVLLSQFVHGRRDPSGDIFSSPGGTYKEDPLPKAVVSMGISLEKLKNHHRRCPLGDLYKLPQWLETITPIYEHYLDVWRLGFQGIIVNLATASPDDEDSLINALPRNEQGDILNEHGDRIDVAHLLKRPLVRTKWITKFIQGYRAVAGTPQYETLAIKWEALQEKARKRHKEETARIVDDDARKTDTSRARDLETMAAADMVRIDRFRQVYAKDSFSLDLRHSNGQRLNCQVELVSRDNPLFKSDSGDLLIREIGSGGRSWLLFAPIMGSHLSARIGDNKHQLVVMIRGYNDEWFELITLATDNEEQVLDWLKILGTDPIPPAIKETALSESVIMGLAPSSVASDTPVGERKRHSQRKSTISSPSHVEREPSTPKKHQQPHPNSPTRPPPEIPSTETTPTGDSHTKSRHRLSQSPSQEEYEQDAYTGQEDADFDLSTLDEAAVDDAAHRDDGAPPPPAHRTLDANKSPALAPPVDTHSNLKRRNSSPLKHEYYPSDVSSESSFSESASEGDYSYSDESSDDELEAAEMPDAVPAISIMREASIHTSSATSRSSTPTPSASASQVGMPETSDEQTEYLFKSLATISYWDNKRGCWKDLWPDICSIVTTPGLIEAYPFRRTPASPAESNFEDDRPLIALDLTPLVMLRTSTALDLEIRSPVLDYARLYTKVNKVETSFFRFRAPSLQECESLYMAVHRARLDNAKYKALEEETRIRAFGQSQLGQNDGGGGSQRRSWFGRKNSYRASARAPSQSAGSTSHSSISASSFLKKLMGSGGQFNIAMSSVHRQSRFGGGENSLYASSSGTPPRSPSVSAANSGAVAKMSLTTNNLKIRLHLLVSASKWEDYGNCYLEVTRPDQGTRQKLRKYQGMEKRVIVTTIPKKPTDEARVVLDIVLGSRCFSRLGSRGILLNVWEEVRNEHGEMGIAPKGGGSGGNVNKWCFQCGSVMEAGWIYGLVTQEVVIG